MSESAEKSYDTLPPNSYDKLYVIQLYFGRFPSVDHFDKWIVNSDGEYIKYNGTEKDLEKLLQEELKKIGKIKLLNDNYEVVDEGMISGFNRNNDKTKYGIIMNGKTHSTDFSIISFYKTLSEIGSEYIDEKLHKLAIEPKKVDEILKAEKIGGRKTKRRKSKRRKTRQRKSRQQKSRRRKYRMFWEGPK